MFNILTRQNADRTVDITVAAVNLRETRVAIVAKLPKANHWSLISTSDTLSFKTKREAIDAAVAYATDRGWSLVSSAMA